MLSPLYRRPESQRRTSMSTHNWLSSFNQRSFRRGLECLEDRTTPTTIAWDGGPTGNGTNWLDAQNWDYVDSFDVHHDVLPGPGDDVTIGSTGSNPAIIVNGSASVHNLICSR